MQPLKPFFLRPEENNYSSNNRTRINNNKPLITLTAHNLLEKNSEEQPHKTFKQTRKNNNISGGHINDNENRRNPGDARRRKMARARGNTTKNKNGQQPNPANDRVSKGIQFHSYG